MSAEPGQGGLLALQHRPECPYAGGHVEQGAEVRGSHGPRDGGTGVPRHPAPGSAAEIAAFAAIQDRLPGIFREISTNRLAEQTVVVVPSLSLDPDVLRRISAVEYYEERLLCLLMLLGMPRTQVIYITSRAIAPSIVDYYLHLLPGVPASHARRRLTMIDCDDGSMRPLTAKILSRPRLLDRIRRSIAHPDTAHITCFNSTSLERTLAVQLGVPLYATDPDLVSLGTKSGGRKAFRKAGLEIPDGVEDVRDEADVVLALDEVVHRNLDVNRLLIKLDEGFSGEGNASLDVRQAPRGAAFREWVKPRLESDLVFEAAGESWPTFAEKLTRMSGIVEMFVEGEDPASPSVQCRIDPLGSVEIVSTHDQVLGGPTGQVFLGCTFPAADRYRTDLHDAGMRVGELLRDTGVIGRYGIDFVSVEQEGERRNYAIEINLRKGGTTLPFLMLQFLTGGNYDPVTGLYGTRLGEERYYYATDNLEHDRYKSLTPRDLVDIVVERGLHFDSTTQEGVVFHLIGAIAEYGKLGVVAVGRTPERARRHYEATVEVLDTESRKADPEP